MTEERFEIVVISPPETVADEPERLNDLFRAGLRRFYLRKGDVPRSDYAAYLGRIEPQFLSRIVVGRHFDLVDEFGLGGAHLPTAARLDRDRFDEWCSRREATGCHLSTSVHSLHELDALSGNFEYAFLSPVFGSISKDLGSTWRTDELARAAYHPRWTVYALGGIDCATISRARRVGFRGAGVIGAVWLADDPVGSFVELDRAAAAGVA